MKVWKLGTTWGRGAPDFFSMIKEKEVIISHTNDGFPKNGDLIIITNGHTVKAITQLTEDAVPAGNKPFLRDDFLRYQIDFDSNVLVANARWTILREADYFKYKLVDGICQVQKPDIIAKTKFLLKKYQQEMELTNYVSLLKFKKQIILQGPPGTGKTFTAKKIAKLLTQKNTITTEVIKQHLTLSQAINSSTDYTTYIIDSLTNNGVKVRTTNGTTYEPKFTEIINSFERKTWLNGEVTQGNDSYSAAIAKFIDNNLKNNQSKLIQFHPAYSYEDFVRGITVQNNGNQIEYRTKNKILGEFAKEAQENFLNSTKAVETLSHENWIKTEWQGFVEEIQDIIEERDKFTLNNKVHIYDVDEDAFRYTGENWASNNGNRMKFSDIINSYTGQAKNRRDIKALPSVSGTAKQHSTYYFTVLTKFKEYLAKRPAYEQKTSNKEELKNYVLIIDEINRANLPAVLGELIYALEYRGESVDSMYDIDGDTSLVLPSNLFIIGTMNTADRSVGHIDYAIRRRFAFVDFYPSSAVLDNIKDESVKNKAKELFLKVKKLFNSENIAADFKASDVQLGHSYFLTDSLEHLTLKLNYEIKPLLTEYLKDGIIQQTITIDNSAHNTEDYIKNLTC